MLAHRTLLLRANRTLGTALVEHNLIKLEELEAANEKLLELASGEDYRQASLLNLLTSSESPLLKEDELIRHASEEHNLGLADPRHYDIPEDIRKNLDLDMCWATWTLPFDHEEGVNFLASAYELSPAVRTHWEKQLEGPILWHATTMESISETLERLQNERNEAAKAAPAS